jgi:hypothetical protein
LFRSHRTTGHSLMASGLVPKMNRTLRLSTTSTYQAGTMPDLLCSG